VGGINFNNGYNINNNFKIKEKKMKMEDYYTKDEIDYICMYYGQIPENLTYNMKVGLVEKLENEICDKVDKIRKEKS
jgi:hypothetical protein